MSLKPPKLAPQLHHLQKHDCTQTTAAFRCQHRTAYEIISECNFFKANPFLLPCTT